MSLPIGRFIIESDIAETISISRAVDGTINSYIDIATFQTSSGQHTLFMAFKDAAAGIYKQYSFAVAPGHTGGLWFKLNPLEDVGSLVEDIEAEVRSDGLIMELRLKKVKGTEPLSLAITLQNLGSEDSGIVLLNTSGTSTESVSGEISAIPYGSSSTDHNQLANRGINTHSQIDAHISSSTPHSGHEKISNKNVADGYAGLNSIGKLIYNQIPVGGSPGTVCAGDDIRLQGGLTPGAHANSHSTGGSDELNLGNLPGILPQAKTHESVDTDNSAAAIHHTLGTGENQAAKGNHSHIEYAPIDQGVAGGSTHKHDGIDTVKIEHSDLESSGNHSHSDIDSHIESLAPHSGHEKIINKNSANGYAGLDANGKILLSAYSFGTVSGTVCEGNDPRLSNTRTPTSHANTHVAGGSDEVTLTQLQGSLSQEKTHDSADTDESENSIHHTLGSTSTQAAPGDHLHPYYAPIDQGVLNGNAHTHSEGDGGQISHLDLGDIGNNTHEAIDLHLAAETPHSGHEKIDNKDTNGGYVGLSASGKIVGSYQVYGTVANTACEGNDSRLSDSRIPLGHKTSHQEGGADELSLSSLKGSLVQNRTHDDSDTDLAPESIHHTIGIGANQAAAGDHEHIDNYDLRYAPISEAVTDGDLHDHSAGNGAQIDHTTLANIGNNTHDQIDLHIKDASPHVGHEVLSNKGTPDGYAALDSGGYLLPSNIPFGSSTDSVCMGDDIRLSDNRNPLLHSNSHISGAEDELSLVDLEGNLEQDRTHDAADTDQYENSLHHTLGNGEMQASAGDHTHDGINGLVLDHSGLSNIGVNTHEQIDSHLGDDSIHFIVDDVTPSLVNTYSSIKITNIANTKEDKVNKGVAGGYAGLDSSGYVPASQISPQYKEIRVVNTIAERDSLTTYEGLRAHVKDASADPTVNSGWAEYLHDGTSWSKTAEQESIDVVLDWANVENTPLSSITDIDDAVILRHAQNTDLYLDMGGANEVSATELRAHVDDAAPHADHENINNKDIADGYAGLDSNGKIVTSKLYIGATVGTICAGDDSRLSNARNPLAHVLASNVSLGSEHTISGAEAGQVLRASGATTANFQKLAHSDLDSIGANTHAQIDAHLSAAAPHSGHALLVHQHNGGDIISAVAQAVNSDTLDGLHSTDFSLAAHSHTFGSLSNVTIDTVTVGEIVKWDGTAWVNNTLSEAGVEPSFVKNTAFNKNFGTSTGTVAEGSHLHAGVYSPLSSSMPGSSTSYSPYYAGVYQGTYDNSPNNRNPYVISHHTGLSLSASDYYGGVRIYSQEPGVNNHDGTLRAQFNNGCQFYGTTTVDGNTVYHTGNLNLSPYVPFTRLGAQTTGGVLNWNDSTNARAGAGYTLLYGNATNGPGPAVYYHAYNIEYGATGNMTQFAIPYAVGANGIYYRSRYNGVWTAWIKLWSAECDGAGSGLDADTLDGKHASELMSAGSDIRMLLGNQSFFNRMHEVHCYDSINKYLYIGTYGEANPYDILGVVSKGVVRVNTATNEVVDISIIGANELKGRALTMAVSPDGSKLFVSGYLYVNGSACTIAMWNGSSWISLGYNGTSTFSKRMVVDNTNNTMYACFMLATGANIMNGIDIGTLGAYNISTGVWSPVGGNTISRTGYIHNVDIDRRNNRLYASGTFTNINGYAVQYVAYISGNAWVGLSTAPILAPADMALCGNKLYVAHMYMSTPTPKVAVYNLDTNIWETSSPLTGTAYTIQNNSSTWAHFTRALRINEDVYLIGASTSGLGLVKLPYSGPYEYCRPFSTLITMTYATYTTYISDKNLLFMSIPSLSINNSNLVTRTDAGFSTTP